MMTSTVTNTISLLFKANLTEIIYRMCSSNNYNNIINRNNDNKCSEMRLRAAINELEIVMRLAAHGMLAPPTGMMRS